MRRKLYMALNLYLDLDGVILGADPVVDMPVLAPHAREFLEFVLPRFQCFWLTRAAGADSFSPVEELAPFASQEFLNLAALVPPARFRWMKTEAFQGDFLWLDDAPLAFERAWLRDRGCLDRWVEVNVRRRPEDLERARDVLEDRLALARR